MEPTNSLQGDLSGVRKTLLPFTARQVAKSRRALQRLDLDPEGFTTVHMYTLKKVLQRLPRHVTTLTEQRYLRHGAGYDGAGCGSVAALDGGIVVTACGNGMRSRDASVAVMYGGIVVTACERAPPRVVPDTHMERHGTG